MFSVETYVSDGKVLGFQMLHARLNDKVRCHVTIDEYNLPILITHKSDTNNKGLHSELQQEPKDGSLSVYIINVDIQNHLHISMDPFPFAHDLDGRIDYFMQITMTRPSYSYEYWLYQITFFEKPMKEQ